MSNGFSTIGTIFGTGAACKVAAATVSAMLISGGAFAASQPSIPAVKKNAVTRKASSSAKAEAKSQAPHTAKNSARTMKPNRKKVHVQVGSASWYGRAFQGKPTASGESYDMYQFTAAHRDLPLGTWVRVTNLNNGKSLILKVNDRGPFVDTDHRIMDVSYAAARMLDFSGRGITRVKLQVVDPETLAYATQGADLE